MALEWLKKIAADKQGMKNRVATLSSIAEKEYKIPSVVHEVVIDGLNLHPHKSIAPRHAAADIDITYEVQSTGQVRGFGRSRQPFFISSVMESQEGEFFDTGGDKYTSHRLKRYGIFSVELSEDGIFNITRGYMRPVRLGTTALIKGYDELFAAVQDQIKRKRPNV